MAEMKRIEYAQAGARKVVGQMKVTSFQSAGKDCWGAAFESGLFDRLAELDPWLCRDIDDYQGLGHMSRFTDNDHFQYVVGKFVQPDAPIPEGLYAEDVPTGTVAKIWIEADTLPEIIESAYLLCTEAIEKTGYRMDHEHFYWCDVYTWERYCAPAEKGQKVTLDYIVPVVEDGRRQR